MAKIGENAVSNAIKRGAEEIRSVITGQPAQESAPPAQESPKPSYEQSVAESARSMPQEHGREMER